MGLSQIDDEDLDNERKSIEKLFKYSDTFDSTVFNSGAGSGKTYALIECLKYIIVVLVKTKETLTKDRLYNLY